MSVYISVLTKEELADLPRNERLKYIGIVEDGNILQPIRCYECESDVAILDEDSNYAQCPNCGVLFDVHYYNSPNPYFSKEIEAGWEGVKFYGDESI